MEITDYILIIRRRWTWVVALTVLGALIGAILGFALPKTYETSTRLFFSAQGGESITDYNQGGNFIQQQMSSYAQVASSPVVLEPVIAKLGLDTDPGKLAKRVRATVPTETVVLDIQVTGSDAAQTAAIANELTTQLQAVVATLSPRDGKENEVVVASAIARATEPNDPTAPNRLMLLAVSTFVGLLLGLAAAITAEILNSRDPGEAKRGLLPS